MVKSRPNMKKTVITMRSLTEFVYGIACYLLTERKTKPSKRTPIIG